MRTVLAIAHRGFSSAAPENTLAAFEKALEQEPDFIECDVRRAKDGTLVVIHDPTVERTTNGTGRVADMSIGELKQFDAGSWFGSEFADQRLPTLDEYLSLDWSKTAPLIELKEEDLTDDVVAKLQARGLSEKAAICSFHHSVGVRLRELDPAIRFSPLISRKEPIVGAEATELAKQAASVNGWVFGVNYTAITPDLVKATHEANLLMEAWTVDDERDMRAMVNMGVDVLASNRVDLLLDVLDDMGVRPR